MKLIPMIGCGALILFIGLPFACSDFEYSDGVRSAELLKLSKKGLIWKTWEGQLKIMEYDVDGTLNMWKFSVLSDTLAEDLSVHMSHNVELTYSQKAMTLPWISGTTYHITEFTCKDPH